MTRLTRTAFPLFSAIVLLGSAGLAHGGVSLNGREFPAYAGSADGAKENSGRTVQVDVPGLPPFSAEVRDLKRDLPCTWTVEKGADAAAGRQSTTPRGADARVSADFACYGGAFGSVALFADKAESGADATQSLRLFWRERTSIPAAHREKPVAADFLGYLADVYAPGLGQNVADVFFSREAGEVRTPRFVFEVTHQEAQAETHHLLTLRPWTAQEVLAAAAAREAQAQAAEEAARKARKAQSKAGRAPMGRAVAPRGAEGGTALPVSPARAGQQPAAIGAPRGVRIEQAVEAGTDVPLGTHTRGGGALVAPPQGEAPAAKKAGDDEVELPKPMSSLQPVPARIEAPTGPAAGVTGGVAPHASAPRAGVLTIAEPVTPTAPAPLVEGDVPQVILDTAAPVAPAAPAAPAKSGGVEGGPSDAPRRLQGLGAATIMIQDVE